MSERLSWDQYFMTITQQVAKLMLVGNVVQEQFTTARNKPFGSAIAFELTAVVLVLLLAYAFYAKRHKQEGLL